MRYKLNATLYRKNLSSNLILILQISITVIIMNMLVGNINLIKKTSMLFEPIAQINGGLFMPLSADEDCDFLFDIHSIESMYSVDQYLVSYNGYEILLFAFDSALADKFTPELSKGDWINNAQSRDYLSVVMLKSKAEFVINHCYTVQNFNNDAIDLKIIGQLKEPSYILNLNYTSNNIQPNHLLRYYNSAFSGQSVFLALKDEILQFTDYKVGTQVSKIVVFDNDATNEEISMAIREIKKTGDFTFLSDIQERGYKYEKEILKGYIPYFVCALSISVVGFLGLIILSILRNMHTYSILHLVGVSSYKCAWMCFENCLLTFLFSSLLVVTAYVSLKIFDPYNAMIINEINVRVTLLFYMLFSVISFMFPRVYLSISSPIHAIKVAKNF